MSKEEVNIGQVKKLQRQMSKAGQDARDIDSEDPGTNVSNNSETEREKTSYREPTGSNNRGKKTYKKR